jgi:hypothetical protein
MKCTACGNENQPGARFCVHCGIVLSATAAPAPAASAPRRPASAQPATTATPAVSVPHPAAASTPAAPSTPAASTVAGAPQSSRKEGPIVAVIALVVILGAGAYFAYRMLNDERKETIAAVEPAKPSETPVAPAPAAPPTDASTPPATQEGTPSGATMPPGGPVPVPPAIHGVAPKAVPSPAESMSGTAADTTKSEPAPPKEKAPKAPKAAAGGAETTPKSPPSPAAPSKAVVAKVPVVAPAAVPDRWQMFADAMDECKRADFFSRLACQQRTRARYCEGYWGQVPQCPAAPTRDHGQ